MKHFSELSPRRRGLRETDRQADRQKPFLSRNPKPSPLLEGWRTRDRRQDLLKLLGGEGGEEEKNNKKQKRKNSLSFRSFALRRVGAAAPGGPVPPHAPRV